MIFPSLNISNPLPGFNFVVAFSQSLQVAAALAGGGVLQMIAGFQEVTGLESSIEMREYKEGGRNDFVHKFATNASFGNITLKRGASLVPDLWQWYSAVRHGSFGARRSVVIVHLDYQGLPALIWNISRALPAKYVGVSWNAAQSSIGIESLELCHEGIELISAASFGSAGIAPRF